MKNHYCKNISPFSVALVISQFNQELPIYFSNAKQRLQELNILNKW